MSFTHVLAVVPVTDLATASDWYSKLFGREPDNNPMPTLVEWQVVGSGWVQIWVDPERAGRGLLNLAVDDIAAQVADLAGRGVVAGEIVDANKGVRTCALTDVDGNTVSLIGGFRVEY